MGVYLSSGKLEKILTALEGGERLRVCYCTLDISTNGETQTETVVPVLEIGDIKIAVRHSEGTWNDELPWWANR